MHAQTARRLQKFRFNRYGIGAIAAICFAVASIFAIQALTGGETAIESQELSPVNLVQEDPPLPAGWVDPYFSSGATEIYVQQDPPLPAGWVDPYFTSGATDVFVQQEDPPLPAGWVDSYVNRFVVKTDLTTLNLDQDGADVLPASAGVNSTTLNLDQDGADIPHLNEVSASPTVGLDHAGVIDGHRASVDVLAADPALSAEELRFLEMNVWGSAPVAQLTGQVDAHAQTAPDYRLVEEKDWERTSPYPYGQFGETVY